MMSNRLSGSPLSGCDADVLACKVRLTLLADTQFKVLTIVKWHKYCDID
jgi:hypothetical protein